MTWGIMGRRIFPDSYAYDVERWGRWRWLAVNLLVALAYFLTGELGLLFATFGGSVTLVWMPSGIALVVALVWGWRGAAGLVAGSFLTNYLATQRIPSSVAAAVGSVLAALVGAFLLRRFVRFHHEMERVKDVLGLVGLASILSTTIAATVGVLGLCGTGMVAWGDFHLAWRNWWLGDAMGLLMVAPLLLTLKDHFFSKWTVRSTIEAALILAGAIIFSTAAFGHDVTAEKSTMLLVIPFMILAAFRFGPLGVAVVNFAVAATAAGEIARTTVHWNDQGMVQSIISLWFFMAICGVTAQVMAAALAQRRRAKEALQESEARYRQLYNKTPAILHSMDGGGRLLNVSDAWLSKFGYSREEVMGRRFTDFLTKGSQQYALERVLPGFFQTGTIQDVPYQVVAKDGRILDVLMSAISERDEEGRVTRSLAVTTDVTERKRIRRALHQSEEKFRSMVETSPDGISMTDMEGRFTFASAKGLEIFGYDRFEEVRGRHLMEFLAPEFRDKVGEVFEELREGRSIKPTTYSAIKRNGVRFWAESAARVLHDADDRPCGMLFITRDITERKRLEAEWHQAQKMDAVGRLAGGVAHDFNNLLMVINGQAGFLLKHLPEGDANRKRAESIRQASKQATAITRQLLTLSRKQAVQIMPVNLARFLVEVDTLLRHVVGEKTGLEVVCPEENNVVEVDSMQLQQVLINLVSNARDAVSEGGAIGIEVTALSLKEADLLYRGLSPGEYVAIHVRDNGSGMSPEVQEHLFEPFFTTKHMGKGTGLGLSTAYGIVRQFGGIIAVQSELGVGSTFSVVLPRSKNGAPHPHDGAADDSLRSTAGSVIQKTILLVEDDFGVRATVREMLEAHSFRVVEAAHGFEALEYLAKFPGTVHLILTDVMMPVMNGDQLVGMARDLYPEIRVVLMSGYASDKIRSHELVQRGFTLLHKPVEEKVLIHKINTALLPR